MSMMPATPPPPLPSAAITARRRATDALSAGQLVALAGDDAAILQSWLRLPAMMQSDDWHVSRTRLWPVSCQPCGCSGVEDFSEGIGRTLMSLSRWLFEMYCISGDHDVKKVRIICQIMVKKAKKISACGGLMRPAARRIFTQNFSSEFLITPRPWREPREGGQN